MKLTRLIISLFALLLPMQAVAENFEPDYYSYDYGDLEVGDSASQTFTLTSVGPDTPVTIDDVVIVCGSPTCDFAITAVTPEDPISLSVDETMEINVAFTPIVAGWHTADLLIASDAHDNGPLLYIPLQGMGILDQTPDEMMLEVIEFYDEAIAEGWLSGRARGQSGTSTATVFREMLVDVYELIVAGNDNKACRELSKVLVRIDGANSPPDLVEGSVRGAVYNMLVEVGVALECF